MKIKTLILFFIGIASIIPVKAQLDAHLLGYVDSTEIIMNNGRRLVYQSLAEGNYSKAEEVYNYLKAEADKRLCFAFNLNEDLYINLLLTNWNNWFSIARSYNEQISKSACYNFSENYVERLFKLTQKNLQRINENLTQQTLVADESSLIELFLQLISNDELNQLYKARYNLFQKKYPASQYNGFFTKYFPKPPVKAGFSMSAGPTFVRPSGNLSEVFKNGTMINMTIDLNVGRLYSGLHVDAGWLDLKVPIVFRDNSGQVVMSFNAGETFSLTGGGLYAGYFLFRTKHFQLAPFMKLGAYTFESMLYPDYDEYNDPEFQIFDSFIFGPGLHTEFKLHEFTLDSYYSMFPGAEATSYISLKMDVGYDVVTTKKISPDFKGNLPYLRLGLVWGFGNF